MSNPSRSDRLVVHLERAVGEWAASQQLQLRRVHGAPRHAMPPTSIGARCSFGGLHAEGELVLAADPLIFSVDRSPGARVVSAGIGELLRARDVAREAAQVLVGRLSALLLPHGIALRGQPSRAVPEADLRPLLADARDVEMLFTDSDRYLALRLAITFKQGAWVGEPSASSQAPGPGSVILFDDAPVSSRTPMSDVGRITIRRPPR